MSRKSLINIQTSFYDLNNTKQYNTSERNVNFAESMCKNQYTAAISSFRESSFLEITDTSL